MRRPMITECEQVITELMYLKHDCLEGSATDNTLDKAISLIKSLKTQEPVEPTIGRCEEYDGHDSWWYQCGKCQKPIDDDDKYCRNCGQAVKWE